MPDENQKRLKNQQTRKQSNPSYRVRHRTRLEKSFLVKPLTLT